MTLRLVVACVAIVSACGGGDDAPTKATGRFGQIHSGLCAAAKASAAGDTAAARRDFDDVHTGLHELAAAVERKDRPAAARLLEAKQRVEANATPQNLQDLLVNVAKGIEITGGTAPDACP